MLVTYHLHLAWLAPKMAGLVIGALFILPFVLLSATAGQWADKHDKGRLMRAIKLLEVVIMLTAGVGFWFQWVPLLLACVLLMGLHSTLFGPVKYAYLPQHLNERELTGGNGMVEMGTFVAFEAIHILAGNGYMEEYVVERLARDAKLIELGGGTTEIQILTIARELTKLFETVHQCTLGEAAAWFDGDANRLRGEFVLLVDGCEPAQVAADEEAFRVLGILLRELPLKQAVQLAVEISGRPRNALYGRALEMKKESC